jgi:hypothetical protein
VFGHRRGDPFPGRAFVVGLGKACPPTNHLAESPEGDPVTVGRAAALVPPDLLGQAVDVLEELPGQAALADAGLPGDRHQAGALLPGRGVEEVLQEPQLLLAADEGGLQEVGAATAAPLGHDAQRPPGLDGRSLALQQLLPGLLEDDGR